MPDVTLTDATEESAAVFSPDRRYRYVLRRRAGMGDGRVLFVMLNPSTADEETNDPTIRRCIGFANTWGYGWLTVCNLYAYRTSDPRELVHVADPVGIENDHRIAIEARRADKVIAAWGNGAYGSRTAVVASVIANTGREVFCLGTNRNGQPRHPLYIPRYEHPQPWRLQ